MFPLFRQRDATPRRGMLLLLVLSILALFLVIGALGILIALRARETARAFASAMSSEGDMAALSRTKLDEALLKLIRGPSTDGVTESLLQDKYGASLSGTGVIIGLTSNNSTVITGTLQQTGTFRDLVKGTSLSVADLMNNPAAIAGRVITFVPAARDATGPTSYRILRTGSVPNTLLLANVKPRTPLPLPTVSPTSPCDAVINGREFMEEAYDSFDADAFLTKPVLEGSKVVQIARPAFGGSPNVDNDGDGVADGDWLQNFFPNQRKADGGELSFAVSYLVFDLDGRINLNAHGSFVRTQTPTGTATYPVARPSEFVSGSTWTISSTVPLGMGYGPADIDAALLVSTTNELTSGAVPTRWGLLLSGGPVPPTSNALVSTGSQWRPAPRAETSQPGRYTTGLAFAAAGPGSGTSTTGTNPLNADYWMVNPALPNSPTDLKAQLQVFTTNTTGSASTLVFVRPTTAGWGAPTDITDVVANGSSNAHPYAIRLDDDAPRAAGPSAVDSPFTVGELERILRQFDADASTLAPRLAAILDDHAERLRMTITTDSWDTPAMTGAAAGLISNLSGTTVYNDLSPETVAGLRFNINRPLVVAVGNADPAARLDYFRQLCNLLQKLLVPPDQAAQWVANVIEFRDPDSIMSWYSTTGAEGVWGAERPEMVITSGSYDSTKNEVTISLYRPWQALLQTGTAVTGATELIDASLGSRTTNLLNLTGTVPGGTDPIWQIAIGSSTVPLGSLLTEGSGTALGTNTGTSVKGSASSYPSQITLLRLADPNRPQNSTYTIQRNAYVPVSILKMPPEVVATGTSKSVAKYWLHWPNRDLVSHGELLAVQSGSAADVAGVLTGTTTTQGSIASEKSLARDYPIILDATIVPSRFTGANVSVAFVSGSHPLRDFGYGHFQYGHFSRWREAGRVNVNTLLANPEPGNPQLANLAWKALVGRPNVTCTGTSDSDMLVEEQGPQGTYDARFLLSGTAVDAGSAFLRRATAIRLANVATVRSHVFAVWITLRITDSVNPDTPQYARLFAIVDRSIPVGYAPGRDLNVRDTILLQRFLP